MNEVVKLCQELVKINSVTGNEKEILIFIEKLLQNNLIEFQRIPVSEGRWNIFAKKGTKKPGILFSGHCDTVPFSDKWTRDPLNSEIIDGRMFGLGSSDMKSGLASIIHAFIRTDSEYLNGLLVTVGEEGGNFDGMKAAVKSEILNDFSQAVISDTSGLDIVVEQSGLLDYEVKISARARHSRDLFDGVNPIHEAAKLITELNNLFDENSFISNLGNRPIMTVNKFNGGIATNVIPPEVIFYIDRRISPLENMEDVEHFFLRNFKRCSNLDWRIVEKLPSVDNTNSKVAQEIKSIKNLKLSTSGGISEIVFLVNEGIDAVFFGPGDRDKAHTADESVTVESLITHNKIMVDLMLRK